MDELIMNLNDMKLYKMAESLPVQIKNIKEGSINVEDGIKELIQEEIKYKSQNSKRSMLKIAGFPKIKTIDEFDFEFNDSISKLQIESLCNLEFIENNINIILLGDSGVGKTHIATAIGVKATEQKYLTYFIKCHDLILNLKKAQIENRLEANWNKIFTDQALASAITDRLIHHSEVVAIKGGRALKAGWSLKPMKSRKLIARIPDGVMLAENSTLSIGNVMENVLTIKSGWGVSGSLIEGDYKEGIADYLIGGINPMAVGEYDPLLLKGIGNLTNFGTKKVVDSIV